MYHYCLFKLIYLTGRRVSEIVGDIKRGLHGLRVLDVDFENGVVTFLIAKRRIYIKLKATREILDLLETAINIRKPTNPYSRIFPYNKRYVNNLLHFYIREVGIEDKVRVVHALRHSFAIHAVKHVKTVEQLRVLQKILAHARLTTTEEYFKYKDVDELKLLSKVSV